MIGPMVKEIFYHYAKAIQGSSRGRWAVLRPAPPGRKTKRAVQDGKLPSHHVDSYHGELAPNRAEILEATLLTRDGRIRRRATPRASRSSELRNRPRSPSSRFVRGRFLFSGDRGDLAGLVLQMALAAARGEAELDEGRTVKAVLRADSGAEPPT